MTEFTAEDVKRMAPLLDALPRNPNAERVRDLLSGGVLWLDEYPRGMSPRNYWALRPLLYYRTQGLILQRATTYQDLWEVGKAHFPGWPGFSEDRCTATTELREFALRSFPTLP